MEPTKASNDVNRQYRFIELGNEIAVTLVSDPTVKMGAAALDVAIGSFNDPEDLQGLAHFLEHMLFMGSAKYPEENAYERFLTEHGGYSNAFTTETHTCYHFEVDAQHLEKALDIFAAIFVSPLMDPSTTERELMSVHSEDKKSEKQDSWRLTQVVNECGNPNHPIRKFIGGNKTSLDTEPRAKNICVRDRLLEFHKQYYSSNLMRLCIAGSQSLDQLETWARETFSVIQNKKVEKPIHPSDPFTPGRPLGSEIFIASVKNKRKITLNWLMPSFASHYTEGALEYFSHLLGHEGSGSLFAVLKTKGWASDLMASFDDSVSSYTIFELEISLTVEGFKHHRYDVVRLTYQYLDMLRREGPQERVFKELAATNKIDFDNMNQPAFGSLAVTLASNMWLYPPKDLIRGPYAMDSYNPGLIEKALSFFRLDNMVLIHMSKQFDSMALDKVEKWYSVQYLIRPIDAALQLDKPNDSPSKLFHLPEPNPFIPTQLLVHPLPTSTTSPRSSNSSDVDTKVKHRNASHSPNHDSADDENLWTAPECIVDNLKCKAWHLQDPLFATSPKLSVRLLVHSPIAYSTPDDYVCTTMLCSLVLDSLNEYAYAATLAGIDYSVSSSFEGLSISVSGYAEKIPLFTEKLLERLVTLKIKEDRFKILKQESLKDFFNFGKGQPHSQATEYLDALTLTPRWPIAEKHYACAALEFDDVLHFHKRFLRQLKLEWLLHGNITRQGALDLIGTADKLFEHSQGLFASQHLMQRTVQLPKDIKTLRFERQGLDSDNPNAAVFVWYQLGSYYDLEQNAMLKIGSSMLEEKIYDTLRTKEQLGYLVFSGQRSQYVSSGFRIAVQSSEYNASHLLSRIDNLVNHVIPEHLDSITDDVWQGMLQSTIAAASERPTTLGKRTRTIWRAVEDSSYSFTRNKNTIEILKTLTKSKVINFLKSIFSSYTRIAILITSSHLQEPLYMESKDTWVVKDVAALRNALPLLALPINNDWQVESQQPELPPGLEAFENGEEEEEDEEEEDGEEEEEEHEEHDEGEEEEEAAEAEESDEEDPEE